MEDEAGGDVQAEHFFEAEGLGAELDMVVGPAAGGAFFVFDGAGLGDAAGGGIAADLDEVGFTGEAERGGEHGQGAEEFPAGAVFVAWGVDGGVGEVAEDGVLVVDEDALDVDEVGAPLAVELVVEGAEGDGGGLGVHSGSGRARRRCGARMATSRFSSRGARSGETCRRPRRGRSPR